MMTFEEAKQKADEIGGVVSWWIIFSVYSAPEWQKFNGSQGYAWYVSKAAAKYFRDENRKWEKAHKKEMAGIRQRIMLRNVMVATIVTRIGMAWLLVDKRAGT